ncbi:hypothetical protein CKA32_006111 [Geitlerinema sp. FC II]|nr:hypothetical protein CKA32_006111 [Geitlerinema sp. FC II]
MNSQEGESRGSLSSFVRVGGQETAETPIAFDIGAIQSPQH